VGVNVGDITARLVAQDEMSGGTNSAVQSILSMAASFGTAQVAIGALNAVLQVTVGTLKDSINIAASVGAELDDLSKISGIGAQSLGEMRYVTQILGEDLSKLTNISFMMTKRMNEDGNAFRTALSGMGVSFNEFFQMSPEQRLLAVSDALRRTSDYATQVEIATGLMGRSGRESMTVLLEPMRDLIAESHRWGTQWSEESVKAAEEFEKNVNRMTTALESLKVKVGNTLIPSFNAIADSMKDEGFWKTMLTLAAPPSAGLGYEAALKRILEENKKQTESGGDKGAEQRKADAEAVERKYWVEKLYQDALKDEIATTEKLRSATHEISVEWEKATRAAAQHRAEVLNTLNLEIAMGHQQMMLDRYSIGPGGEFLDEQAKAEREATAPFQKRIGELETQRAMLPEADVENRRRLAEMIEWERQKMQEALDALRDRFAQFGNSTAKAAESVDGFRYSMDRAVGKTTPGTSAGTGPMNVGSMMTPMDWQIYNGSVNAALFGKGNSAETNRLIYAPTLFPGQSYTPRSQSGPSGMSSMGVNVTQNFPIASDSRAQSELQRLIEQAIAEAMRRQGMTLS
jgi:hypothetical protein